MPTATSSVRRFSFGGYESDLAAFSVWKFDIALGAEGHARGELTCFVKQPSRGASLQAFFSAFPGARVFGTGLPLSEEDAILQIGRPLLDGEVLLVDD